MAWWTWAAIAYSIIGLSMTRLVFTGVAEGEKMTEWGDFWLSLGAALVISAIWGFWMPFVALQKGAKLMLSPHPGVAASKIAVGLEYEGGILKNANDVNKRLGPGTTKEKKPKVTADTPDTPF